MNTLNADAPAVDTPTKPSDTDADFKSFLEKATVGAPTGQEDTAREPEKPVMYTVFLNNDQHVAMQAVIACLTGAFDKTNDEAWALTMEVHNRGPQGKGPIGTYPKDEAETRVSNAQRIDTEWVHANLGAHYPHRLNFTIEKTED